MESYDIIANQPVVIDNVRPGSRGEDGRPAPGGARGGAGRDPRQSPLVLHALPARHVRLGLSCSAGSVAQALGPGPPPMQRSSCPKRPPTPEPGGGVLERQGIHLSGDT